MPVTYMWCKECGERKARLKYDDLCQSCYRVSRLKRQKSSPVVKTLPGLSIGEVAAMAQSAGMSYGKYVATNK